MTLDTAHDYVLGIPQPVTDRLLTERAVELGAQIRRGVEVTGLEQDDDGVDVDAGGRRRGCGRAGWSAATAGAAWCAGRSGSTSPASPRRPSGSSARCRSPRPPEELARDRRPRSGRPTRGSGSGPPATGCYRAVVPAASVAEDRSVPPTLEEFRTQLRAYAGTDFGVHSPRSLSRFTDATRLAERYRVGRVLLAGDAAHVHPPLGGQGLNLGIQDAFNLGWKLAAEVGGWAPDGLLDTYGAERRPVAEDVLTLTRAQSELLLHRARPAGGAAAAHRADGLRRTSAGSWPSGSAGPGSATTSATGPPLLGRRLRDIPLTRGRLYELTARRARAAARPDRRALGGRVDRSGRPRRRTPAPTSTRPPSCCGRTATSRGSATTRTVCVPVCPPGSGRRAERQARSTWTTDVGVRPAMSSAAPARDLSHTSTGQ